MSNPYRQLNLHAKLVQLPASLDWTSQVTISKMSREHHSLGINHLETISECIGSDWRERHDVSTGDEAHQTSRPRRSLGFGSVCRGTWACKSPKGDSDPGAPSLPLGHLRTKNAGQLG